MGRDATDSLRIATRRTSERVFSSNVFGIGARYDLNLRRVAFQHPGTVAPIGADSQRFWFNSATGFMDSVADVFGNKFRFIYDNDARPIKTIRFSQSASAMAETLAYDTVGRLRRRLQRTASNADTLHRDSLIYDQADRIKQNVITNDYAGYNALGPLDTVTYGSGGYEAYRTDALGLRYYGNGNAALNGTATYKYLTGSERMDKMIIASQTPTTVSPDSMLYSWFNGGALGGEARRKWFFTNCSLCSPPFNTREVRTTTNNIDASWRLISSAFQLETLPNPGGLYKTYQRKETYRYDPLGRRVWKEMIRDTAQSVCVFHDASSGCRNEVTRTVWDGANILYDVRMLADTTGDGSEGYPSASTFTGSVGYTHAGGIDVPLDLWKGTNVVVPYADWRGTYDVGTCPTTRCTDNQAYFPLKNSTSFGDGPTLPNGPPNWFGEVIGGQTDGSGYKYMRNRYYDARSGRFTQEDPIGLAGGLSSYGFASGDPIQYADPFGFCPAIIDGKPCELLFIGIAVSFSMGPMRVSASAGFYLDENNKVGAYSSVTKEGGVGTAPDPTNLSQGFASVGMHAEAGASESSKSFEGDANTKSADLALPGPVPGAPGPTFGATLATGPNGGGISFRGGVATTGPIVSVGAGRSHTHMGEGKHPGASTGRDTQTSADPARGTKVLPPT